MKLFHWDCSETLKQYSSGDIIVMAEDVTQARVTALAEFVKWVQIEDSPMNWLMYSYGTTYWNEDDEQEYQGILTKFKADIATDPIDTSIALFIMGSS
jgi:hypothetical protein